MVRIHFILCYIVSVGRVVIAYTVTMLYFPIWAFFLKTSIDMIVSETLSQSDERQIRGPPFWDDSAMVIE